MATRNRHCWLEQDGSLRARVDDGTDGGKHADRRWGRAQ
jgi:hypothetical protein